MTLVASGRLDHLIGATRPPRAILFDLDDTLVDRSLSIWHFAARFADDFAAHLGSTDLDVLHPLMREADRGGYRTRDELTENFLRMLPWRATPAPSLLTRYWADHFAPSSKPSSGALELVDWLRANGLNTGIITNGGPGQHQKIDALGVRHRMDVVIVSEEIGIAKPDARVFHRAAATLRLSPADIWFVGDHPVNDVIGATSAGMTAFWLRRMLAWPVGQPEVGVPLNRLEDLLPLVQETTSERRADTLAPFASS